MKIQGITRLVDDLGRIAIPKDLREKANIKCGDELEIAIINNVVIMGKVEESEDEKE